MSADNRRHPRRLSEEAYAEANHASFITIGTKNRQLIFADKANALTVIAAIRQFVPNLIAFCIMPDHVHFVYVTEPDRPLPTVVAQVKGKVAFDLHRLGVLGTVWQRSYWDRYARKDDDLHSMVEYVLNNPLRRQLCERREEWPYADFCGLPW